LTACDEHVLGDADGRVRSVETVAVYKAVVHAGVDPVNTDTARVGQAQLPASLYGSDARLQVAVP